MSTALVPLLSTIARWFIKMRAFMTGIVLGSTGIGLIVLLPVANYLISSYGWRTSYIIIGILSLVVIVPAAQFPKCDPCQVVQLPYFGSEVNRQNSGFRLTVSLFERPFATGNFGCLIGIYFCAFLLLMILIVHSTIYAIDLGISPTKAVSIVAFIGGVSIVGRVLIGVVADRIGSKLPVVASYILVIIALLWLLVAKELWALYVFGAAFGFGHGGLQIVSINKTLFEIKVNGCVGACSCFLGEVKYLQKRAGHDPGNIKRITRRRFTTEENIRIILEGFRRDTPIRDLCRPSTYYAWLKISWRPVKRD